LQGSVTATRKACRSATGMRAERRAGREREGSRTEALRRSRTGLRAIGGDGPTAEVSGPMARQAEPRRSCGVSETREQCDAARREQGRRNGSEILEHHTNAGSDPRA
jgi:hypothetical protein